MKTYFVEYEYTFSYIADDCNKYIEIECDCKEIRCHNKQDLEHQLRVIVEDEIDVNGTERLENLTITNCEEI